MKLSKEIIQLYKNRVQNISLDDTLKKEQVIRKLKDMFYCSCQYKNELLPYKFYIEVAAYLTVLRALEEHD